MFKKISEQKGKKIKFKDNPANYYPDGFGRGIAHIGRKKALILTLGKKEIPKKPLF